MTRCTSPLSDETLLDHWLWEPSDTPRPDVEEHLLGCAECSRALERLVALADAIRDVARAGEIQAIVSPAFLERVAREGLRLREHRLMRRQVHVPPERRLAIASGIARHCDSAASRGGAYPTPGSGQRSAVRWAADRDPRPKTRW